MFTASTEHDSKTNNTISYTCFNKITSISLDLETFENLNGLVMEESVYNGTDKKF